LESLQHNEDKGHHETHCNDPKAFPPHILNACFATR
jgi:hypothetical protein